MATGEADLGGFLEAAGRSLAGAQGELVGAKGAEIPAAMAISEVELEVKATLEETEPGEVALRPVTSGDARVGGLSPEAISTLRVRYVALGEEAAAPPPSPAGRSAEEVIEQVRAREDVAALERILGRLSFEASFVPSAASWLVSATDPRGRTVREVVVADT